MLLWGLMGAQAKLEQMRSDTEKEIALWKQQIREAEAWIQQKQGFESFLQAQIAKREELARGLTTDKPSSPCTGAHPALLPWVVLVCVCIVLCLCVPDLCFALLLLFLSFLLAQ